MKESILIKLFYPTLTGSKTPTSRFERNKEDKWEITVRKDPISLANHQWGMKKTPTMEVSLYNDKVTTKAGALMPLLLWF